MHMKSTLINDKNKKVLFTREDTHWWLTGFKPCEYLKPKDLTLNIEIKFKNQNMAIKFMKELEKYPTAIKSERVGNVVSWTWPGAKTDSISETISEYVGGEVTYDDMLNNTINQLLNSDLILSKEELNKYYESK